MSVCLNRKPRPGTCFLSLFLRLVKHNGSELCNKKKKERRSTESLNSHTTKHTRGFKGKETYTTTTKGRDVREEGINRSIFYSITTKKKRENDENRIHTMQSVSFFVSFPVKLERLVWCKVVFSSGGIPFHSTPSLLYFSLFHSETCPSFRLCWMVFMFSC